MHYLKTPLNDDLYNQILESSNSPDLITSLFETKEEKTNANSYLIRILSNNEYDKYIKNGTCSGAIEIANVNVWHYDNTIGIGVMNRGYNFNATIQDPFITHMLQPTDYGSNVSHTFIANGEHIQNNNFTNSLHRFFNDIMLKTQAAAAGSIVCYSAINTKNIGTQFEAQKNAIQTNSSIESYAQADRYDWCRVTLYYNLIYNFRPIFQYKDNNKSKNIYY